MSAKQIQRKVYHTHAMPGKRIRVRLRSGEVFIDKLKHYPIGNCHEFEERGKVKSTLIEKIELYSKAREVQTALMRINRKSQNNHNK